MKVIWDQLIEAVITYTDFKSKYNISAFNEKTNFLVCLSYWFLECRSTNLLRLFSGNLPAMFEWINCVKISHIVTFTLWGRERGEWLVCCLCVLFADCVWFVCKFVPLKFSFWRRRWVCFALEAGVLFCSLFVSVMQVNYEYNWEEYWEDLKAFSWWLAESMI